MYYWYVLLALEVLFVIHAIKSGRGVGWVLLILFFPLVGCIAYLALVIVPELAGGRSYGVMASALMRKINPKRDFRRRVEDLQITNSVTNKTRLAEECLSQGLYEEAVKLYQESLQGVFENDPSLLLGLARAYSQSGRYAEARSALERLGTDIPGSIGSEARLLSAMVYEESGDVQAAVREYESIIPGFTGPEAKCRYGLLLEKMGQREKAQAVFRDVVTFARRSPRFYRKLHRKWIDIAKKHS